MNYRRQIRIRGAEKGRILKQEEQEAPTDWKDSEAKDLWRAARSLYREYLKKGRFGLLPENIQIPCVRFANNHRLLDFAKPQDVHWIDEVHLADSTLEKRLLSEEYKLFIFRLQEASEINQIGVQKLSSDIQCEPDYEQGHTDELYRRYESRRIVLNKVMNIQLPKEASIKAVTGLTLKLSKSGQALGNCPVLSWKDEVTGQILVDTENKWRALSTH